MLGMRTITVILPVFGEKYETRLRATAKSWVHQSLDCRVLISEAKLESEPEPHYESFAAEQGFQYVCHDLPSRTDYVPGRIRNLGARSVETDWIYFCDADVVVADPRYLENVSALTADGQIAVRPFMGRVTQDGVEEFCRTIMDDAPPIELNISYPVVHFEKGEFVDCVECHRETHKGDPYVRYDLAGVPESEGLRPLYHCGSVFCSVASFYDVGGYCEQFRLWGCEDDDLQYRLSHICETVSLWDRYPTKGYKLLHLDHDRDHVDDTIYQQNRVLKYQRRDIPIAALLKQDRDNWDKA